MTIYESLERSMTSWQQYQNVPIQECGESLVAIEPSNERIAITPREDSIAVTGLAIFVRQSVLEKIETAADILGSALPEAKLQIGFGYRSKTVQESRFKSVYDTLPAAMSDEEKLDISHRSVAIPWLAGHPAGAAIDVEFLRSDRPVNFGTRMWDFNKRSYVFAPVEDVGVEARGNRMLLRRVMTEAGFAPFDGEWWHFSYGDREWAHYYQKPAAIYGQVEYSSASETNWYNGS